MIVKKWKTGSDIVKNAINWWESVNKSFTKNLYVTQHPLSEVLIGPSRLPESTSQFSSFALNDDCQVHLKRKKHYHNNAKF